MLHVILKEAVFLIHFELHFDYLLFELNDDLVEMLLSISQIVKISDELLVLLGPLLDVVLGSGFILDCVDFDGRNGPFHVSQLSAKLVKCLWVFLLILENLVGSRHHKVVVQLPYSLDVLLLIV